MVKTNEMNYLKSFDREITFILYNYKNIDILIEKRKEELIDKINVTTSAWLKSRKQDSNSIDDILTRFDEDKSINRLLFWKKFLNRFLSKLYDLEGQVYYYYIKYKFFDNMSDDFLIEKFNLNNKKELIELDKTVKRCIYVNSKKYNMEVDNYVEM